MAWNAWLHPFDARLVIDGVERLVQIARLSVGQKANFQLGLARLMGSRGSLAEDATTDEREAWDKESRRSNQLRGDWLNETIAESLRVVEPWMSGDGIEVKTSADLLQAYQDETLLTTCVLLIWTHNTLTADQRKNLPSPADLVRSSVAGTAAEATGETPAPTAENAEPKGSVRSDGATDAPSLTAALTGGTVM